VGLCTQRPARDHPDHRLDPLAHGTPLSPRPAGPMPETSPRPRLDVTGERPRPGPRGADASDLGGPAQTGQAHPFCFRFAVSP
jgi:hypothetical protein